MKEVQLSFGEELRDESLKIVEEHSGYFMTLALCAFLSLPEGEYTGEEIRLKIREKGIVPHHPNAWGALIMSLVRCGGLTHTGHYSKMKVKTSHARRTAIYYKPKID